MNKKNTIWITAGIINLFTALLHTIGGQIDLVNSLLNSDLSDQAKTEWLGVWHMITVVLFATSYYLIRSGLSKTKFPNSGIIKSIGAIYVLFSLSFIFSSIITQNFAPQWILLLPIGILAIWGIKGIEITTAQY